MHNEKANARRIVEFAIKTLADVANDWEIIVVESGSTDGTTEIVRELAQRYSCVVPIFQKTREGMGSALRQGYKKAIKELVWHIESDSPFDLRDIRKALVYMDRCDGVIGYRTSPKSEIFFGWVYSHHHKIESLIRGIFHIGYNLLIRVLFGLKVKDVNFSFKIFKTSLVKKLKLYSQGWFIDAEILLEIKKRGGIIIEEGIHYKQREFGKSTVRLTTPIKIFWDMLVYRFTRY
jgi:glycosyltransferase involved in cell wall biosynthesis